MSLSQKDLERLGDLRAKLGVEELKRREEPVGNGSILRLACLTCMQESTTYRCYRDNHVIIRSRRD